jgi:hypothetical protein
MITLQQQTIQAPALTEQAQPVAPEVDPAEPAEIDEILANLCEDLAFWHQIDDMMNALAAAGYHNR